MSDKDSQTEKRAVSGFDRVSLNDFGELIITQGAEESLTIEAEPDVLPKIKSEVRDGRLKLEVGRGWIEKISLGFSDLSGHRIRYFLSVRDLHELRISGKGDVTAEALDTDSFAVGISGMGTIKIGALNTQKLSAHISGRGEFTLAGSATHQEVSVSGSGEYNAQQLESQSTVVRISGHGNATVWAAETLQAAISGYGKVEYLGSPQVNQAISGLGSVQQIEGK